MAEKKHEITGKWRQWSLAQVARSNDIRANAGRTSGGCGGGGGGGRSGGSGVSGKEGEGEEEKEREIELKIEKKVPSSKLKLKSSNRVATRIGAAGYGELRFPRKLNSRLQVVVSVGVVFVVVVFTLTVVSHTIEAAIDFGACSGPTSSQTEAPVSFGCAGNGIKSSSSGDGDGTSNQWLRRDYFSGELEHYYENESTRETASKKQQQTLQVNFLIAEWLNHERPFPISNFERIIFDFIVAILFY